MTSRDECPNVPAPPIDAGALPAPSALLPPAVECRLFEGNMMKNKWFVLIAAVLSIGLAGCPPKEGAGGATGTGGTGGGTGGNAGSTTGDILVGEFGSLTRTPATFR